MPITTHFELRDQRENHRSKMKSNFSFLSKLIILQCLSVLCVCSQDFDFFYFVQQVINMIGSGGVHLFKHFSVCCDWWWHGLCIYACSGQEHTVPQSIAVVIQRLENLLQILGFMDSGLTTRMALGPLTVILITSLINLRYFIAFWKGPNKRSFTFHICMNDLIVRTSFQFIY